MYCQWVKKEQEAPSVTMYKCANCGSEQRVVGARIPHLMGASQPACFAVELVECSSPSCKEKQVVHVRIRPQPGSMMEEQVICLKCHTVFIAQVTDYIIAGPFPLADAPQ
jgi:hypothetical protein